MYCPICSTKVSLDQKFCRSCGLGLEKIAQSVSEHHPTELTQNLEGQENKLEGWGIVALSICGIGLSGFFFYMVQVGSQVMALFAQPNSSAYLPY
jgi:hypothetical protein